MILLNHKMFLRDHSDNNNHEDITEYNLFNQVAQDAITFHLKSLEKTDFIE